MSADTTLYSATFLIGFGDCDPAGIVYYPNYLRWFDSTYHGFMRSRGKTHQIFCNENGLIGTGLMDVGATFRSPGRDGDDLVISIVSAEWRDKSVRFNYRGTVGDRLLIEGYEVRGLFMRDGDRLRLAHTGPLKAYLEGDDGERPRT
ncbi:acyl-CoA thioesterase [Amorphus orientalis]|uniref:Acyl-CoA thioesterase FadM n=1 Tax=Amorphus orientalis TaxID=649198 RepID=A0AAE4AUM1_9HYPH|nr:thioesterase family protein [Amorphus orientalis]MDQ0317292.1 acyl-CoA thioesterase FadM [Amorphus orientalis]